MSNRYAAYPQPVPGGFRCMIRVCRDARPNPVMAPGDRPKIMDSEGEAWKEIALHLLAFMNGREIRGETFEIAKPEAAARANADREFGKIFLGGGRVVEVERLEAAR